MAVASQRGAPVIYVASSARELPVEVREWLGRAETRAVASPHIYDMLAELARGKKLAAIIVNIQSVDWSEMEFFDYAARLGRQTPIYVTGPQQQRAKLEAACRRGALLFDARSLEEEWRDSPSLPLQSSRDVRTAPCPTRFDAEPAEPGEVEQLEVELGEVEPELSGEEPQADAPEQASQKDSETPGSSEHECGALDQALLPQAGPACEVDESPCDELVPPEPLAEVPCDTTPVEEEPAAQALRGHASWPVRLARLEQSEPAEGDLPEDNQAQPEQGAPVVFPWSTNLNRPRRTPPPPPSQAPVNRDPVCGTPFAAAPLHGADSPFKSVRLAAEEIAALMGPPPRREPEARS